MKYTIEGFSQEQLVSCGLDCVDACLLRFIVDFIATGRMEQHSWKGVPYYWFKYAYVLEQMPILGIKAPDALARRLKKLTVAGVLLHHTRKDASGTRSYYCLSEEGATLLFSRTGTTQKSDPTRPKSRNIDSSITDSSIKDSNKLPAPAVPVVVDDEKYQHQLQERLAKAEEKQDAAGVLVYGLEVMHGGPFANYPQEWANAKRLVKAVHTMGRGNGEMIATLRELLRAYVVKRKTAREVFWKEAPLTPSGVLCRLEQLVGAASKQREDRELDELCIQAMRNGA